MEKVVIVDYGMGNLHSVQSALMQVGTDKINLSISQDINEIQNADRIVFPGQGAAADCMQALNDLGLADAVRAAAKEKPFLGICMGMQVLLNHSEENDGVACLNMYPGTVKSFKKIFSAKLSSNLKVPHMGWNNIHASLDHPVWSGIKQDSYFYFVHSYFVEPEDKNLIAGTTDYGIEFASVIADGKVFAMQCHPEKSGDNGLSLLANFIAWNGEY
jgi:glutamine amidotransferase